MSLLSFAEPITAGATTDSFNIIPAHYSRPSSQSMQCSLGVSMLVTHENKNFYNKELPKHIKLILLVIFQIRNRSMQGQQFGTLSYKLSMY
jgi:hypothetical protein